MAMLRVGFLSPRRLFSVGPWRFLSVAKLLDEAIEEVSQPVAAILGMFERGFLARGRCFAGQVRGYGGWQGASSAITVPSDGQD